MRYASIFMFLCLIGLPVLAQTYFESACSEWAYQQGGCYQTRSICLEYNKQSEEGTTACHSDFSACVQRLYDSCLSDIKKVAVEDLEA